MTSAMNKMDPSQNFIDRYPQRLNPLFLPRTIAVIGAKDDVGSVGYTIMNNLRNGLFNGDVYPVNPKRNQVMGLKSYPKVADIPVVIDLAIIVTPASTVPSLIAECVEAKVKSVVIISAGFKELGAAGMKLEEEILFYARQSNMPIVGPNCLGIMNPIYGLNATFAKGMALPGHLAFISQSGAMCTAVLDWSLSEKIGFSAFVSVGSMIDVGWGELIDYLGNDPHTHSLLLYMETVGDARLFMTAAREVALEKPVIIIKAGKSQAAAKAAASHTGSLAGSDEVFEAALERAGVLRVETISDLFNMASILARQPRPKGPCLSIITNAGGPAVLATDATVLHQAEMTNLSDATIESLNAILPSSWSHSNPIDILGDANAARYAQTLEVVSQDPHTDGILVILSPQDMTDPVETAQALKRYARLKNIPVLASWMGGESVKKGIEILSQNNLPCFSYPDDAAKIFATMWQYTKNLRILYETPIVGSQEDFTHQFTAVQQRKQAVQQIIDKVRGEGRTLLTEVESKQVLACYQIPIVPTALAQSVETAVSLANEMGYPVVLKIFSQTITHKTDVGGVKLNLQNAQEVESAFQEIHQSVSSLLGAENFEGVSVQKMIKKNGFELIVGSITDSQFGPVMLFGMGGKLVEVFKDHALALPPLNQTLARRLMEKTKIYEALLGVRGESSVDLAALEEALVNFSRLIIENRRIKECDINPLLASNEGVIALDARILLYEESVKEEQLPRLAIRPYPENYIQSIKLRNGKDVILRPIRPEDEPLIVQFHYELSENSVRQRYFEFMSLDERITHERLVRICFVDYDREWATVAEINEGQNKQIIGVGRLSRIPGTAFAQFKLIIIDAYHQLGLGTQFLQHLLTIAKKENIERVDGFILSENEGMIKICLKLGFHIEIDEETSIAYAQWVNPKIDNIL